MANLIEPSSFDLIVVGTGLPQCIVAAAAASNGHSVLHLDACDFYGSHWSSLPLQDFSDWCHSAGQLPFPSPIQITTPSNVSGTGASEVSNQNVSPSFERDTAAGEMVFQNGALPNNGSMPSSREFGDSFPENSTNGTTHSFAETSLYGSATTANASLQNGFLSPEPVTHTEEIVLNTNNLSLHDSTMEELGLQSEVVEERSSMYQDFHIMQDSIEDLGPSRRYCLDLAGPKLAYCGGSLVDLLLRSGANNYLEFKSLEASFMWSNGVLLPVPSSRADVFKDRTLINAEKRHLMRFFKLVVEHDSSNPDAPQISPEELESPFVKFLHERQVPLSVQSMILYAIALSNHKQGTVEEGGSHIMKTKEGLELLALYLSSVGRFVNSTGAFLYPLYGQGELPQAFSRSAAVKGALYALKMPIQSFLKDKVTGDFKGIKVSTTEQLIFSQKLVVGPTMLQTVCKAFNSDVLSVEGRNAAQESGEEKEAPKVVRGICITDKSLRADLCTLMVVFPPHCVTVQENGVIRALQLGSSVSVCPEGKFLVQLSMVCSNESVGIEALQRATQFLFNSRDSSSTADAEKPTLLWAAFYAHNEIYEGGADVLILCKVFGYNIQFL
ncbi:hypothetical protein KP509_26G050100 [Ceratopteris richardii]|uniref:RAE1/2 domain-containing protein n=1 Tax=Ceratopteris richardii TaxID=49495 RepID=A0A8T2RN80_CERRI|nr:hypothetical protein KP509_26G050100 [Ceratopteris richardii]